MMPTSPPTPLTFRTSGFPQYGCKAGFQVAPAHPRLAQARSRHTPPTRGLPPPFVLPSRTPNSRSVSRGAAAQAPPCAQSPALPQGPSLRSGFCCPRPSSLTRPHPPHSPAHRDFTASRLIRHAFAVRERLGDPRVVPCFHCPFRPDMSSSSTPGSRSTACAQFLRRSHWPSPVGQGLGTPKSPTIRFPWGSVFEAVVVRLATTCRLACLPWRIRPGSRPADGDVYVRASGESVTLLAAGYHYGGNWAISTGGTHTRWNVS